MYFELYLDVFFLENFMMDSLLLAAVNRIMKCGRSRGRIFLGGGLGSLLTCVVFLLPIPGALRQILCHLAVSSIMIAAGLRPGNFGMFARTLMMLYAAGIFTGGIMYLFRPYMRYASLFYFAAVAAYYLLIGFWKVAVHIFIRKENIVMVTLYADSVEQTVPALIDTGNELRDTFTGDPVSMLDLKTADRICREPEKAPGFHFLPCRFAGGEGVIKVFRIRKMCIHTKEERWVESPLFGIGEGILSEGGDYSVILNPEILSG